MRSTFRCLLLVQVAFAQEDASGTKKIELGPGAWSLLAMSHTRSRSERVIAESPESSSDSRTSSSTPRYRASDSGRAEIGTSDLSVDLLSSRVQTILATVGDNETVPEEVESALAEIHNLVQGVRSTLQEPIATEQSLLQALADAYQACADVAMRVWPETLEGAVLQAESVDARQKADAHHDCRILEVQRRGNVVGQNSACSTFHTAISEMHTRKPDLTFASLNDFFTNKFDAETFKQKATACEASVDAYQTQVLSCRDQQDVFEKATCQWHSMAVQADSACASLQLCRDDEGSAMLDACERAKDSAERWGVEAAALDHIECLLDKLGAGNIKAAAVRACTLDGNASVVNITCPDAGHMSRYQQKCDSLVKPADLDTVPGSLQWVETQYHEKSWFSDATNEPGMDLNISSVVSCELPALGSTTTTTAAATTTITTTTTTTPVPGNLKLWNADWHHVEYYDLNGTNRQQVDAKVELQRLYQCENCNIPVVAAGPGAVYMGIHGNYENFIAKKPFDGSPITKLLDGTKSEDPAWKARAMVVGASKLYWHGESRRRSAAHRGALVWCANFDGSDVQPLVYEDEFEEVRHSTDENFYQGHHSGLTLSEDEQSLYFISESNSKSAIYLYQKPLDSAGLGFVKQLIPPKMYGGISNVQVRLDKTSAYIGYYIDWNTRTAGFARCSYAAEDVEPCLAVHEGRVIGDMAYFQATTDYVNNKVIWQQGSVAKISDMDGSNGQRLPHGPYGGSWSIGPAPLMPLQL